ncbi:hypothetical protein C8J57DRAFT_1609392 [Mycena rebaudengoi]|nr:hypothetical protein C8J57DRAFT_1609392 [Mycena rebaudengoi]
MPPKGSGKLRDEDFRYNEDRSEVQCKACTAGVPPERRQWIALKSAARHLLGHAHLEAVSLAEETRQQNERLAREREADSATEMLRETQLATQNFSGPVADAASRVMSEAEAEMWDDYCMNGAAFSAGDECESTEVPLRQLREEAEAFGLWNPEATARKLGFDDGQGVAADEDDDEDDFLAEFMRNIDVQEPEPEEIQATVTPASDEWYPYPNKMMFLLDTMDNLARLRISSSLMRVFLWVLKVARCKDVPSFDHLRRVQKTLRAQCGVPCTPCKSVQGNVFFMNDPKSIIAKDWANPTTRKLIHIYPEIPEDGIIHEIWHAQKWRKDMDPDILSPMYAAQGAHYYVNEVSRLRDGRLVIPVRWLKFRGKVYADAFAVEFNEQGEAMVMDQETVLVCAEDLTDNYYDLEHAGKIPKWEERTIESGYPARMPNPKRIMAAGRPLYCSFVNYFSDDVSGNRSKSWNKHWNAYMTHQNLPRRLLQQEFHVHFVSTSPNASVSEQFCEFKAAVEVTHTEPVEVQDEHGDTFCFCLHVNAGPSDNPMQSEVSAHIGGKGNCFCRKCLVGGTQKEKATNEGYHALFEAGVPRSKEQILLELEKQVKLACSGVIKHVKDSQTSTGVKDTYTQFWIDQLISRFKEMRRNDPDRSVQHVQEELIQWTIDNRGKIYSPFLTMKGFDPTKDTPIEILHTILLGVIKYIWHITHTSWSPEQKQTYSIRLQSTNTDGLSIHAIRSTYIMQYAGSLIGRQFKTIAQTNVFHVRGLVTEHEFMAWKAAGELAALLWFPEIRNLEEYRRDLKVAVANVLDIFATIDPSKIIAKIKYHLLVHTDEDVVQFGPLIGVATEVFESFNGVFRYCSILSNHLAPSRDIAQQLGDQEGLKHRITGGWWPSGVDGKWERAGSGVRRFMAEHPVLQKLVGWTEQKIVKHGDFKLVSLKRGQKERDSHPLKSTSAARALNYGTYDPDLMCKKCVHVLSESLDECRVGSWIFTKSPLAENSPVVTGRISDILMDPSCSILVVVEVFQVLSSRDETYGMPVLVRRDSEVTFLIVPAKNTKFLFNVQHDCNSAKCEATGVRLRMQERVASDKTENYIEHKPLDRFFINTHAFHNAHLLRATLPRDLVAPVLLFPDRQAKHHALATELRDTQTSRKAAAEMKKRKRAEPDGDDGNERPTKARKGSARRGKGKRRVVADATGSMIANRSKRVVTRTEKAKAAEEEGSAEDSDSSDDDDSLPEDGYVDSDAEFSG